jgi:hypothetical protein
MDRLYIIHERFWYSSASVNSSVCIGHGGSANQHSRSALLGKVDTGSTKVVVSLAGNAKRAQYG